MTSQGQVGPRYVSDGATTDLRLDRSSAQVITDGHGRYVEAVYRGTIFTVSNTAAAALSNASTTATGLILSNPAGSGKNIFLLEVTFIQTSTAAASANAGITLAANINPVATVVTHTTPITINPGLLGGTAASIAKADSAATLPAAPTIVRAIWQPSVSATATTGIPPFIKDDIGGAIAISPGCTLSLSALGAVSGIATFTWEELPI